MKFPLCSAKIFENNAKSELSKTRTNAYQKQQKFYSHSRRFYQDYLSTDLNEGFIYCYKGNK